MTEPLTKAEKRKRNEKRKQQKAASKTMKTVTQPKPEEKPPGPPEAAPATPPPVNLCDNCAYEFGECEGKPKFASEQDETLTGPAADRVVKCEGFLNVAEMPTAQEAAAKATAAAEYRGLIIVCSGGCGKTTEGIPLGILSGEFKEVEGSDVPEWTCQECLDKREGPAAAHDGGDKGSDEAEEEPAPETQVIRKDLPERPDPKRFQAEEDFGFCPSCGLPLKRTALNRYQDAIRCTNGRCRAYRAVVKTISTGVK